MENGFITLKEALALMSKKDDSNRLLPFDLTYRTYNSTSKKGGKLKTYFGSRLLLEKNPNAIQKDTNENILDSVKAIKNAHHFDNRTRNIELSDSSVAKVRIDFMISINNKKIIY
jgi:hypothetical protein